MDPLQHEVYSNHEAPSHSNKDSKEENRNIVIIKNLQPLVKDLTLFTKFQRFGDIKGVSVLCDKMTKVSKEIGFVQFSRADQVEACIQQMNFKNYMGRELYLINKDKFQEILKKQTTYIVSNLPQNLNNQDFRKYLDSFGEVVVSELYYTKVQN